MKKQFYTLLAALFAVLSLCAQNAVRNQGSVNNNSLFSEPAARLNQNAYGNNVTSLFSDGNANAEKQNTANVLSEQENLSAFTANIDPVDNTPPCTAPTAQPTGLNFGTITSSSQAGSFTAAAGGATGYLVVRSIGALNTIPFMGTAYTAGEILGNGVVVQSSSALNFTASNLIGNTRYTYTVFAYNSGGCTGGPAYNTLSPLSGLSVTCPATPTSLSTPVITPNSFQLTWNSSKGGGANPVSYTLEVATNSNFSQPITGSPFTIADNTTQQSQMAFTVQGLVANTTYYYRLTENGCNTTSATGSVTTACNPVSLPYTQTFNSSSLPNCWSTAIVALQSATKISLVTQGSNPATSPSGVGSHFVQYNSASAAFGGPGSEERLITPALNTVGVASVDVEFYWRADNNPNFSAGAYLNEGVQVQYSTDYGATWVNAGPFIPRHDPTIPVNTAQWKLKLVTLPVGASNQPSVLVAFKFHSENGDNMFLDFKIIEATPGCYVPTIQPATNLAAGAARINWTAPLQPALTYEVYYSTSNVAPTSSTAATATGITSLYYDATGLAPSTTYYAWVRSNCGNTGKSVWSASISFSTLCAPANTPYTENFDAVTPPALPACTAREDANNDGSTWTTVVAPTDYTGKTLQYAFNASNAANDWFFTRGVNLTGGTSYTLRFRYGNNSSLYPEKMKVYYGTGQTSAAMTTLLQDYPNISGGKVNTAILTFIPATSGVYYFGFNAYSDANQFNLFLDDISVNESSAAPMPVTLLNFSGQHQGNANLLRWNVAQEKDVRSYWVERSENNVDWTVVGTVNSLGNIATQRSYTFTDNNLTGTRQYYRLRMVDLDGSTKLSNTILIKGAVPVALSISGLFPNPTTGSLNLLVDAPRKDNVTLFVIDAVGRVVQTRKTSVDAGANTFALDVSTLSNGTYLLKLTCEGGCEPTLSKFVKN